MKVGIIQPNFLPWRGYFDFINQVDVFIFLDDVKYTKNDWRNRNQIKTSSGPLYITVPVSYKHSEKPKINQIKIASQPRWKDKLLVTLSQNYSKTRYFDQYWPSLKDIICQNENMLWNSI